MKISKITDIKEYFKSLFNKIKSLENKKLKKIILIVLIALIVIGGFTTYAFLKKSKEAQGAINTATARIGNVRYVISASGTVEPKNLYKVVSSVRGDVISDTFEVGDVVEKGEILYELDKEDFSDTLEKAELSMEKTRDSYNNTMDSVSDLNVKAPISGVISNMYVKKGDSVSNGAKICDIIDKSKMVLTIPFNMADIKDIYVGNNAEVILSDSFYRLDGIVTRVSSGSLINEMGVAVSYVDIEVNNPGGITPSHKATAVINSIGCNSEGTFDYYNKKTVTAKTSGDVKNINFDLGDNVTYNSTILVLESDTVDDNIKNANRSLREAQISLDNTYEQLEDYTIKSKIDGTVIEKTIKAGDTLDNTNGNTTMCVIADMSIISFTINVDELDVDKIKLNQKVDITADALPGRRFEGHVNSININGTTANGVTTYPVEVIVDNPDGMLPQMNVNAEIVIEEKINVLTVPVSSVMRGNLVYVKEEDAKKHENNNEKSNAQTDSSKDRGTSDTKAKSGMMNLQDVPEGFVPVRVVTGLNDENNIEIISGLNEGDTVYVKSVSNSTPFNMMGMPGMGGMSGGMGGMSGGMGGANRTFPSGAGQRN